MSQLTESTWRWLSQPRAENSVASPSLPLSLSLSLSLCLGAAGTALLLPLWVHFGFEARRLLAAGCWLLAAAQSKSGKAGGRPLRVHCLRFHLGSSAKRAAASKISPEYYT